MELAVLPPGTTEPGLNEHVKLLGSPEQVSATVLSNGSDSGTTFTVDIPEPPEARVIVAGFTFRVSFVLAPLPQLRLPFTADDIWFVTPGLPTA